MILQPSTSPAALLELHPVEAAAEVEVEGLPPRGVEPEVVGVGRGRERGAFAGVGLDGEVGLVDEDGAGVGPGPEVDDVAGGGRRDGVRDGLPGGVDRPGRGVVAGRGHVEAAHGQPGLEGIEVEATAVPGAQHGCS